MLKTMCRSKSSRDPRVESGLDYHELAEQLYAFYSRFEDQNHGSVCSVAGATDNTPSAESYFTCNDVLSVLNRCRPNKAAGPDGITNKLLRTCASQLAPVLTGVFNQCAAVGHIPNIWKMANIKPLPKKPKPVQ